MDLHIPPDIEANLRTHAALAGMPVEAFALESIQDRFFATAEAAVAQISPSEWEAEFRDWIDSFPVAKTALDDSRSAMYEGRGE